MRSFLKTCLLLVSIIISGLSLAAQLKKPKYNDSLFSTYYHQRVSQFRSLPSVQGQIVFLGNSLTDGAEWSEMFDDGRILNRGISGDVSAGLINRADEVVLRKPKKIFLLIGTNDLARGMTPDSLVKNLLWLADYIKQESPSTQLFVQSIMPVNKVFKKFPQHMASVANIILVNGLLSQSATKHDYLFLNLDSVFCNTNGELNTAYTNDGLHLNGLGYNAWKHHLFPYVYDLQSKASMIPLPQKIQWKKSFFPVYQCRSVLVNDTAILKEANVLLTKLKARGLEMSIVDKVTAGKFIELKLGRVESPQNNDEAYHLQADDEKVVLTANTAQGIFNGIQTLLQLSRDNAFIDNCEITDWPAFSWRGYMVDAGRNYQSMDLLKQQIDIMSRYKLNIFHFHLTEDIAWRLFIKQYPQLVAPENMLRNKGQYYTEAELHELISYSKERYITLVPEVDMPGHSAAFKRTFNTDMQSDSGMILIKNILEEIIQTYQFPYVHIGADEVKITNKNFVPDVTNHIESFGSKVIGWEPGGNYNTGTIRQLWMEDKGRITAGGKIRYLDSRHLYLNHMDPLETVVTIFNRQIAGRDKGDEQALGAILCVWPDRRVDREEDVLRMNAVYPGIITFSERTWRGGGQPGMTATIAAPQTSTATEFREFENRMLDHKSSYFEALPFPYRKQSSIAWKLYGPYYNKGNLKQIFGPEKNEFNAREQNAIEVTGGTIILRHWWHPTVKGALEKPEENTTWYATTMIWSDENKIQKFWIGFDNPSRSYNTDSPVDGSWNNLQSQIWFNGEIIAPPRWKHSGQKGHAEIPLQDEGYEYRSPASIKLRKGWNTILVKLPVGAFKGKDWQNPVKWMFTCVPF